MPDLISYLPFVYQFFCMFARISALLFVVPIISEMVISPQVKILLSVALCLGFYPLMPKEVVLPEVWEFFPLTWLILKEVAFGLTLGFVSRFLFEGIVMAANIVGYQMGFGTANLLLPNTDLQINSFTAMHRYLIMLIFLSLGLHFFFIASVLESFRIVAIGKINFSPEFFQLLLKDYDAIFLICLKLASPMLIALLFATAALGLIARAVPQLNVFTLSFPVSFFLGLTVYILVLPLLPDWLQNYYAEKGQGLFDYMAALRPY
jgi:flagellar biosynthetic protein FliR